MKVEQSYVIMAVSHFQEVGDVELVLTGLFQEGQSVKQPLIMPVKGTSEEEQMVQKIMTAAGRFVSQQQGRPVSRIRLPLEKYEELGKPTVTDTLNITIELQPKEEAKSKTTKDS